MISLLTGTLVAKDLDRAEVLTSGGVGYELAIPLGTYESLPRAGEQVRLHTSLVVREDEWLLYGFATPFERAVFRKLLQAKGVGPSLALGMLSTLSAERLVRAIREKDIATLQQVPRVGRKKAEQLILDLADKLDEVAAGPVDGARAAGASDADAIRALVSLGYAAPDAEKAVRASRDSLSPTGAPPTTAELVRAALPLVGRR
ncbi:MAG: Holliday junction branch migration protein RuvA [Gemmatimonadaceae bacterium]|nr:Holliday junction branch migration protein RuvA [Gemmatimonadaceae bacterium]